MSAPVQLVGGPLDGHTVAPPPGKFMWVAGARVTWRERFGLALMALSSMRGGGATSEPKTGRALYEVSGCGVAIYAGHRTLLCSGCGSYHGKVEGGSERRPCPLGSDS